MALHPWFAEQRLAWSRRPGVRRLRVLVLVLVLLAVLAPIGVAAASLGPAPLAAAEACLRMFVRWPVPVALLLAVPVAMGIRRRTLSLAHELRTGWWAAAPIAPRRTRQAVFVFGIGIALTVLFACVVALMLVAAAAWRIDLFWTAFAVVASGIGAGAALGLIAIPVLPRSLQPAASVGRRHAAFSLNGLGDARLPCLLEWQRRSALSRWRQGGNAWLAGALLLALPAGVAPMSTLGLLVMVLSLAWFGVVLRASADVTVTVGQLLRATPVPRRTILIAALRYPAFALACASVWALAGACLVGPVAGLATAWCVAVGVLSLPTVRISLPLLRRSP